MPQPPQILCRPFPGFDPRDWASVAQAFAEATPCPLQQTWLDAPHPRFQPAEVRAVWNPHSLWVYATLTDSDIFNAATELNQDTWNLGDVFEIFLRPAAQEVWFEFHVTPENQKLQLRWPGLEESYIETYRKHGLSPFLLSAPVLESRTLVLPSSREWRVLVEIPAATIAKSGVIVPGDEWRFSFSRYDYTRGETEPVLSSSSPHALCQFDRQQEWGRLLFDNGDLLNHQDTKTPRKAQG